LLPSGNFSVRAERNYGYFKRAWSRPGTLAGGINWYRALFRSGMQGRLKNLDVRTPALLIWGDRDAFLMEQTAEWTRRYVPNLTLRYIKGASHWVQQASSPK
jgi:epoxide hydrolase 4